MSSLKGGKTSPRLLEDLRLYNPDRLPQSGYNILSELAFPFDQASAPPRTTIKNSCKHRWIPKPRQCLSSVVNSKEPHVSVAAAYCLECRRHVRLSLDTTKSQPGAACPNSSFPLHHFQYQHDQSPGFQRKTTHEWQDERLFQCTAPACGATLWIWMDSPKLNKDDVALLEDKALIGARAQKVIEKDRQRFEGHAVPTPLTVMTTLKSYTANSFKLEPKKIPANNKKWMLCLGEGCKDLVERLGFKEIDDAWDPPHPNPNEEEPFKSATNVLLDDTISELDALMNRQSEDDKRAAKTFVELRPDVTLFQKLLGCDDYTISLASRTSGLTPEDEHPYYAGLGAIGNFHDNLIQFAYERQVSCDIGNSSYYLECLDGIAEGRKSEDLKTKAAIEASTGTLSNTEIKEAYASFNLDMHAENLEDEHVIGVFQSRAADAPMQEAQLRRDLTIIGKHRQSQRIEEFAANTVTTYEQALSWLGATADMDDSFIVAMFGVKANENAAYENLARTCVKMIADHRESSALKQWLDTGELGDVEMDVAHAYQLLELPDRTIPDDSIIPTFLVLAADNPSKRHNYEKALKVIADDRNSAILQAHLADMNPNQEQGSADWPVGLSNIGNTCYLNSLLQYFFSIKPIRDLVLDFDNFKEDLQAESIRDKQVGGRKISRAEAKRAQDFTAELQQLFKNMITSSNKTVTPRKELAHLTILSSQSEADVKIRRESVSLARKPQSQAEAMAQMTNGIAEEDTEMALTNNPNSVTEGVDAMEEDKDSEKTLVDKSQESNALQDIAKQAQALEDKENLAPTVEEIPRPRSPEKALQPLAPASPSKINEQQPASTTDVDVVMEDAVTIKPPNRPPPPVPPRSNVTRKKDDLLKEAEFEATQRDVTEVIDNVFFQLQCAIKPNITKEDGKQSDTTKELFYGRSRETYSDDKVDNTEAIFQDIKVQLPDGPRHVYEALDAVFDEHNVRVGTSIVARHSTILELPPILQIFVSRGQFDKSKGQASKSMYHLELDKTIYMDRYLDTEDPELLQKRSNSWKWKRELKALKIRKEELSKTSVGLSMPEALELTAKYLDQIEEGETTPQHQELAKKIQEASNRTQFELEDITKRITALESQLSTLFQSPSLQRHGYNLFSVFIHLGGLSSGHYWILIHDFQSGMWRKYNDGYVTKIDEKEVFSAGDPNRPSTSTFVVYVKAGMEEQLTQTLCREIIKLDNSVPPAAAESNGALNDPNKNSTGMSQTDLLSADEKLLRWSSSLVHGVSSDVAMG